MTDAAEQLVAAIDEMETKILALHNTPRFHTPDQNQFATNNPQTLIDAFKTKSNAINLDGCSNEFKDAFTALKQTAIASWEFTIRIVDNNMASIHEDTLLVHKGVFAIQPVGQSRSADMPASPEAFTKEYENRTQPYRDAKVRFKEVCQTFGMIVQFAEQKSVLHIRSFYDTPNTPPAPPISPLDLPPVIDEDLEALREKVLAEEKAKELALIEEERNFVPLVEEPNALIPLHPQHQIWITPDRKNVIITGRVILREGFLELLACRVGTKEHESILAVRVEPQLIHAALLAANARQGRPMQVSPVFAPATGDRIDITLRWKDESEIQHESPAQDWVWDMSSPEDSKKPMATHWVFSGSRMLQDFDGNEIYAANVTGELFALSNFVGSILDVPIRSSDDNTQLQFACFTERIPPLDTLVTIVLTPSVLNSEQR